MGSMCGERLSIFDLNDYRSSVINGKKFMLNLVYIFYGPEDSESRAINGKKLPLDPIRAGRCGYPLATLDIDSTYVLAIGYPSNLDVFDELDLGLDNGFDDEDVEFFHRVWVDRLC